MKIVDLRQFAGPYGPPDGIIYVGREVKGRYARPASPLANVHQVGLTAPAEKVKESMDKYRRELACFIEDKVAIILREIARIKANSILGCWCCDMEGEACFEEPFRCHAQIVWRAWRYLNEKKPGFLGLYRPFEPAF